MTGKQELSKRDLQRLLKEAQRVAREEELDAEEALNEAYRRLGWSVEKKEKS